MRSLTISFVFLAVTLFVLAYVAMEVAEFGEKLNKNVKNHVLEVEQ